MKIAVAGTGYVGLVTGVTLASIGHIVTCVDVDEKKIRLLTQGISPIYEDGLEEMMRTHADRLCYTTDYKSAYSDAEVIFIGVGTPEKKDGSANLSYVYQVSEQIGRAVRRDCVVVVKSTVPIGTNEHVEKRIQKNLTCDVRVDVVSNPEFLAQGTAVQDTICGARIVIGTENERARQVMQAVFENFHLPFVFCNRRSAEMIKYASNAFLALKISYINEIANLCEMADANIEDVTKGMGLDPRIGAHFLRAGIGYGGSCFPKDTKALHWLGNAYDVAPQTIKATIEVNETQKLCLIKKAKKYFKSFEGLTVAVLGLTFKPDTDDLREAPSLENIPIFLEDKAHVKAWDPVGATAFAQRYPEVDYKDTIEEAIAGADLCFIFTEWPDVKSFEPSNYAKLMACPLVLDGRNCYSPEAVCGKGMIYESIGRPTMNEDVRDAIFQGDGSENLFYSRTP